MTAATASDAFSVPDDVFDSKPAAGEGAGTRARVRARVRPHSVLVNSFVGWGSQTWSDLRDAWWTPASLPTFQTAWAERMPDRDRVPGNNSALYAGWVAYNYTLGLAIPALAIALVGAITPLLWIARHPARLALSLIIAAALYGLTLG